MAVRLVHSGGASFMLRHSPNEQTDGLHVVSGDRPCPTVSAEGVCGVARHQAWLEFDMRTLVIDNPRSGWGPVHARYRFDESPAPTIMGQARGIGGQDWSHWWIEMNDEPESEPDNAKPVYRVPSMEEIAAVRGTNGLTVASTFSGCGGSCLGFEMAGFRVVYASEFVPEARETYKANHPGVPVDDRDVRKVHPEELLAMAGLEPGQLDVLEGSPPCASFSTAGARHKHWGQENNYSDTKQRTDDLFFEFARLLEGLQPRAFIAENVSGLVKGVAKGYFKEILARLKDCGYVVEARLLDAQWLGVPQARQRLIFQGLRADLDLKPAWPTPLPYRYSLRDAIGLDGTLAAVGLGSFSDREKSKEDMPTRSFDEPAPAITTRGMAGSSNDYEMRVVHDTSGLYGAGDVTDRPAPTVTVGVNSVNSRHYQVEGGEPITHDPETGYRISLDDTAIAPEWDKLEEGESSDRYFNLVRPSGERPSPTVTQAAGGRGTAGVTHPTQRRKFTLLELRRVCAFPDDFVLTGNYGQRWERLGRAVPPLMMRAVAEKVAEVLG